MFDLLKSHRGVGIDFDETLINHPNSASLWEFIRTNPYDQEFSIVTFRSGGLEKYVWIDLKSHQSLIGEEHFKALLACPHDLWVNHHANPTASLDDPYLVWKGATCAQHNITALIDDMTEKVIHGCRKYRVEHFHPDDFI